MLLGYIYGTPLLYQKTTILVAFSSSIAFIFLTIGLIFTLGRTSWPMNLFFGDTVRAKLLRRFLPIIFLIMVLYGWFDIHIIHSLLNSALAISLYAILSIVIVFIIISRIAKTIDNELDRKETERRSAQEALLESEEKYRIVANNTHDWEFWLNPEGRFLYTSPSCKRITGYDANEFIGDPDLLFNIIHPDDRERFISHNCKAKEKHIAYDELEFRIIHADGTVSNIGHVCQPVFDSENRFLGIRGNNRDITERKRVEEALRESEEQIRLLLDSTAEAIYGISNEGTCTFVNPACLRILGYKSTDELLGKHVHYKIHHTRPDGKPLPIQECRMLRALHQNEGTHADDEILWRADGTSFPAEYWSHPQRIGGKVVGAVVAFIDITERKSAELQLKLDEARLEGLLRISHYEAETIQELLDYALNEAIMLTGSKIGGIFFYNEARQEFTSNTWSNEVLKACSIMETQTVCPIEKTGLWGETVQQRKAVIVNDFQISHQWKIGYPEGHVQIKKFLSIPVLSGNHIVAVVGVANKETEYDESDSRQLTLLMDSIWRYIQRKQAEEALKQSEMRFRELFDRAPVGYHEIDTNGRIVQVNSTELEMLGYTEEEMIDHFIWEFIVEKEISQDTTLAKLLGKEESSGSYERTIRRKDGVGMPALIEDLLLKNPDGEITGMRSTLQNISESKRNEIALHESNIQLENTLIELRETQKMVFQQERLRSLGQMASGIAHDINNSLTPILGYSDLLLKNKEVVKLAEKQLTKIRTASQDIRQIIERMKEFYRPKIEESEYINIDLNDIIKSTIDLTSHRWKDIPESQGMVIKINPQLQENLQTIKGNESEIREALTNLIMNASDAMLEGGTLSFITYSTEKNVVVEVVDTGIGMDEEIRQHCLDPFFSTKGDKGTGLGLSMVYGIMQRHEGQIEIVSEKNAGTTIRLVFPIPSKNETDIEKKEGKYSLPGLKILCVDDDENVREMLLIILEKSKHFVKSTDSGKSAINIFYDDFDNHQPFDLVITDLGMPYMDGKSVAESIKKKSPNTPIILMTGWGAFIEAGSIKSVDYILKKPITMDELHNALISVIKKR
jgi:PAS domain S-box-containing protein